MDKPYFRLRLVDDEGEKYQKVYGLFSTIVHPLGTVKGWESDAMPATQPPSPKRGKAGTKQHPAGHHVAG
jgi:hypothetical protein